MKFKKFLLLSFMLVVFFGIHFQSSFADEIVIISGEKISGTILTKTDGLVEVLTNDGVRRTFSELDVSTVDGMTLAEKFPELELEDLLKEINNSSSGVSYEERFSGITDQVPMGLAENKINAGDLDVEKYMDSQLDKHVNRMWESYILKYGRYPPLCYYADKLPKELNFTAIKNGVKTFIKVYGFFIAIGYLLFWFPFMLIAMRFEMSPILIWIPFIQLFSLLRLAGRPRYGFVLFLLPVINILYFLVLFQSICCQLQQPKWFTFFMLVPGLNILILWYLAFSEIK